VKGSGGGRATTGMRVKGGAGRGRPAVTVAPSCPRGSCCAHGAHRGRAGWWEGYPRGSKQGEGGPRGNIKGLGRAGTHWCAHMSPPVGEAHVAGSALYAILSARSAKDASPWAAKRQE
jgi:hypothetical protein